jgi:hypothetical protein
MVQELAQIQRGHHRWTRMAQERGYCYYRKIHQAPVLVHQKVTGRVRQRVTAPE